MEDNKIEFGYLYNDSFSENDFLNAVLKNIKDDNNSPSYIFDEMKIGKIERINFPIILTSGKAKIEYSRMLGFDRIETTTKYKTKTYGNGYQNKTTSTSSRTITDWKKDIGVIEGSASSGMIDDNLKIYDEYITNHKMDKNNISKLNDDVKNKYTLTDQMVDYFKNDILNKVYQDNISNQADHIKDEKYYGDVSLYDTTVTIISLYTLKIKIRNKELLFIASSNGDIDIKSFGEYPSDNYDEIFKYNKKITEERLLITKKPRMISKLSLLFSILSFILFLILGITLDVIVLTIISFVILVLGFIVSIKYMIDVKNMSKPYYKKIADNNKMNFERMNQEKEASYQRFRTNIK